MTNITISDLNPSSSDSYMRELSDEELNALTGGFTADDFQYFMDGLTIGARFGDFFRNLFLLLD